MGEGSSRESGGIEAPALFFGIGNPGRRYEETRHNVGMEVVRAFARVHGIPLDRTKFESRWGDGRLFGRKVLLAEPQTYVNLCGRALLGFTRFFKLGKADILVICDDVALPLGRVRLRASGSDGGHNGLKSVEGALGTRSYSRLRVGVGKPEIGDLADFVLSRFRNEELELKEKVLELGAKALAVWLQRGVRAAMNEYNGVNLADPAGPDPNGSGSGAKGRKDDEPLRDDGAV